MKIVKWFYEALGNNKEQRFRRLLLLIITIGFISMMIINVGYEKEKGGLYWKPADISLKK